MAGEIGRKTDHWGSRFGFIMAAVGSSVGLGNFWRFPFTAGENGGGAFIIIYLFCVLFLGLTVLMAEYALGRKSGMSAIEGIHSLARAENKSENWQVVGWIGSLGAFFILTFYIVISAWVLAFIPQAFGGTFNGFAAEAARLTAETGTTVSIADVSASNFGETISNKYVIGGLLASFLLTNVFVVARGVKGGIEKAATVLMPAFFILLIGIVGFALVEGDAGAAADFLLTPDFSEVTMGTFLEAVGQAFFSLSVGSCLMITYGAYLSRDTNIPRASAIVASADTMVA
ncbi:MAG TPA: sodium-dependent transporter, partial [Hyphomonas sp.]|nr:sodium-dependent transporter [Hyphomonas sp.]HCJ16131.1 sodium-dependent transporter [Hyphomonas sp.]